MDLTLSDDQQTFVTATTDWCREAMPLEQARNRPVDLWNQLDAMGWLGMTAPETGLDHATEALVFAELGRFLAPVGMISTAVAARWAAKGGRTALALCEDDRIRLFDADGASRALGLVAGGAAIANVPELPPAAPGLDLSASLVVLDAAPAFEPVDDKRAAMHLQLLAAAFAVGCADAARGMAADYAKVREQFERPIGWFQALKHICADMSVRTAVARSQLYYGACALDADDGEAEFHIAAAKHLADRAATENGRANIQVHGGIGMTDEAYPHLCLKRAHLLAFIAPARRSALLGEAA